MKPIIRETGDIKAIKWKVNWLQAKLGPGCFRNASITVLLCDLVCFFMLGMKRTGVKTYRLLESKLHLSSHLNKPWLSLLTAMIKPY